MDGWFEIELGIGFRGEKLTYRKWKWEWKCLKRITVVG